MSAMELADALPKEIEERYTDALRQLNDNNELLVERLAELELALEDQGWIKLLFGAGREFSRDGLQKIIELSRVMYIKNPLIQRGVEVKMFYVWGQGLEVTAQEDPVKIVVDRFMKDRGNRAELFSHQARTMKEKTLETDGNLFLTLFPSRMTGHTKVRSIPVDEISDIICNPNDKRDVWFYRRQFIEQRFNYGTGDYATIERDWFYPDIGYTPRSRAASIEGKIIRWSSPVLHMKVGGLDHMRFGVPEVYAALDWAKAYKGFLEDWASLVKALARFAWKLTTKGKVADGKSRLDSTLGLDGIETNPPPISGAAFVAAEGNTLEAIPKTGAHTSAEDGRQLRLMVASAMNLPDTILASDPDMGNLATAKTLDRPTELGMRDRQMLWEDVYGELFDFVLKATVMAPRGRLQGTVLVDEDGLEEISVAGKMDTRIDVNFPPILERDVAERVKAIVTAATLDGKPDARLFNRETLIRQLLLAIGVDNVDELVTELVAMDVDRQDAQETVAEAVRELREAVNRWVDEAA